MSLLQTLAHKADSSSEKSPIFLLLFMALTMQLLWATQGPVQLHEGGVVDTDSYMRLNRVLHLVEAGDWFDSTYPRSNAPYGEVQHWTRAMDGVLLAGASLGSALFSFPAALHWWGVLLSPLIQILTLFGLLWLLRPVCNRDGMVIAGGIFVLQPGVVAYYLAGRVDHHGILLFSLIILLASTYQMSLPTSSWKMGVVAGAISALGVWLSIEFLIGLCVSMAFLSWCWVVYEKGWEKRLLVMTLTLWSLATIALLIERGVAQITVVEFDRYSIVHWTIFTVLALMWLGLWALRVRSSMLDSPIRRVIAGSVAALLIISVVGLMFPKFFHGPLVNVDPRIMTLLWDRVTETQPLISTHPWQFGRLIFMLGIALPGIPYLVWLIWSEKDVRIRLFWIMVGICIVAYLPLAVREMRWIPYAEFLFVLPYAHLVHRLVIRVEPILRSPWQGLVKGVIVMVAAFGFVVGGSTLMAAESSAVGGTTAADCPLNPLSEFLAQPSGWGKKERTIMAFVDFGPELLYRTPHRVIATPYHRNAAGVIDTYEMMSDTTGNRAKAIAYERQIDLILVCTTSPTEPGFYQASERTPSLYDRLRNGNLPEWVRPVNLPLTLQEHFRLFEVSDIVKRQI